MTASLKYENSVEVYCRYARESLCELLCSDNLLLGVTFSGSSDAPEDPRVVNTGLRVLNSLEPVTEVWYSDKPVTSGIDDDVRWSCSQDVLFATLYVDERRHSDLRLATHEAYATLLRFIRERGYPNLLRAWNYMPDINGGESDEERYKQFCHGRHDAFSAESYSASDFPAACALGHHSDHTVVYLLAAKQPAVHFENPRQLSAYQYPREYGIRSPSFARASVAIRDLSTQLYLSGTASITGHQSYFPGDIGQQLNLTTDNIKILLDSIGEHFSQPSPELGLIKVYLRHVAHIDEVEAVLKNYMPEGNYLIVKSDICRSELLIEIDGVCHW